MNFKYLSVLTLVIISLTACGNSEQAAEPIIAPIEEPVEEPVGNTELTQFTFLQSYNPSLNDDVT